MNPRYRRMLEGISRKIEKKKGKLKPPTWFLYILCCNDGSFYTGITNDLERRLQEHNQGRGARYTRSRIPVRLCYQEVCSDRSHALVRESAVKALSRKKKAELVTTQGLPEARYYLTSFSKKGGRHE